ncbi:MAG: D-alanyl-D-alanine carboxypeptidase/D-alanyl-D-alanine-endopeptidase [Paracoccaceae bacterium]
MISRRQVFGGLLSGAAILAGAPLWAEAPTTSRRPKSRNGTTAKPRGGSSDALVKAANLGAAVASYIVMDAMTGAVLDQRDAESPLPPASVAKAVTSLYALNRLGPGFRYRTRLLATGPVVAGVVQGDLVLAGSGDPTLQTDQLGDLAAALSARGVKGVTGRFLTWDGALPAIARISADQPVHVGYNPSVGGLNLNFNRVHFEWKRAQDGWSTAMDARGERFVPSVRMAKVRIVAREAPLFTYEANDAAEAWTVASGALGKGGSRWLPVRHPSMYVGEVLQTLARAQGIALPDPQPTDRQPVGQELAGVDSAPLSEILREMLRFSTNITAEAVGLRASGAATLAASGAAMTDWVRATYGGGCTFVDHSGLGSASRVTATDMARILHKARLSGAGLHPLLRNMGMRDAKGAEVKNHPVRVMAKSGTLNFVSGLAGHVMPPKGRELIFAIFLGDVARRDALSESDRERPPGGEGWTRRARTLQGQLIARWAEAFV